MVHILPTPGQRFELVPWWRRGPCLLIALPDTPSFNDATEWDRDLRLEIVCALHIERDQPSLPIPNQSDHRALNHFVDEIPIRHTIADLQALRLYASAGRHASSF